MSDMFENHIDGFSTRRLKCFKTNFKPLYMGKSDTFLTSPDNNKGFRFATQSLHMAVNFIITKSSAYSIVNDQNSLNLSGSHFCPVSLHLCYFIEVKYQFEKQNQKLD